MFQFTAAVISSQDIIRLALSSAILSPRRCVPDCSAARGLSPNQEQEEWRLNPHALEDFVALWSEYDDGTSTIDPRDLEALLLRCARRGMHPWCQVSHRMPRHSHAAASLSPFRQDPAAAWPGPRGRRQGRAALCV